MATHNGKNVKSQRPAVEGDNGYDKTKDQVVVTYDDGVQATVPASEVKS